ncbi:MAG: signal peptidase I, partial [Candidatus Woesearchaeota archaeon]
FFFFFILHIPHVQWATFADTKSMDPVLDAGMIGLQIVPQHPNHIHVGDIITYKQDGILIIHRVIDIRHDTQGWYAITQGDNIPTPDPYKVRFEQVHRLLIGVLY